ncbi:hypothetical protein [Alishewanella tabrizica]|uniref:hypothetical protein n=1 Tax=Alishewanella tabrizica TaxID=671278 RepID=UPI00167B7B9B|nr:hypothetical protein [Alishewanella tabrizica]
MFVAANKAHHSLPSVAGTPTAARPSPMCFALKGNMKPTTVVSVSIFAMLSLTSVLVSGAPLKVHLVNIFCFFLAFVVGAVAAERYKNSMNRLVIWLLSGAAGLLLWDGLSALVIVKAEFFMGWYLKYPIGLLGILLLHFLVWLVCRFWPFNKQRQPTRTAQLL